MQRNVPEDVKALARKAAVEMGADSLHDATLTISYAIMDALTDRAARSDALADALREAVDRAAIAWCGEKERETSLDDIKYFKHNWRALPGLRQYVEIQMGRAALASHEQGKSVEGIQPHPLDEWHEDYGDVVWWCWQDGKWLGEPAHIGSPISSDWPDYHTHWTPHPPLPAAPTQEGDRDGR